MRVLTVLVLASVLAGLAACSAVPRSTLAPEAALETMRRQTHVAGLAAGVLLPDGRRFEFHVGYADQPAAIALTGQHEFRLGSLAKPLLAYSAHRLAEQGVVDLRDPVPGVGASLEALLRQKSGVISNDYRASENTQPCAVQVSQHWPTPYPRYSNTGYEWVCHRLLQRLGGPLDALLQRVLPGTAVRLTAAPPASPMRGHLGAQSMVPPELPFLGAMGAVGRIADLLEVSAHWLAETERFQADADSLGWSYYRAADGQRVLTAGGSTPLFKARWWLLPESGAALILASNSAEGERALAVATPWFMTWLGRRIGRDLSPEVPATQAVSSAAEVDTPWGVWSVSAPSDTRQVWTQGAGALELTRSGPRQGWHPAGYRQTVRLVRPPRAQWWWSSEGALMETSYYGERVIGGAAFPLQPIPLPDGDYVPVAPTRWSPRLHLRKMESGDWLELSLNPGVVVRQRFPLRQDGRSWRLGGFSQHHDEMLELAPARERPCLRFAAVWFCHAAAP